jgi:hypothetical protein
MDPRAALLALAKALPEGATVPVPREWILVLLEDVQPSSGPDLTVEQLAARFKRSRSTLRTWCELGRFPGAYRFRNREWRVPPRALAIFEANERERGDRHPVLRPPPADDVVDLSDWRRAAPR